MLIYFKFIIFNNTRIFYILYLFLLKYEYIISKESLLSHHRICRNMLLRKEHFRYLLNIFKSTQTAVVEFILCTSEWYYRFMLVIYYHGFIYIILIHIYMLYTHEFLKSNIYKQQIIIFKLLLLFFFFYLDEFIKCDP